MKRTFKKTLSMLVCAVMVLATFNMAAFAAIDYVNDFNTSATQNMNDSEGVAALQISNGDVLPIAYEAGVGGRNSDDYSLATTITDSKASGGIQLLRFADYNSTNGTNAKFAYKLAALYTGDLEFMSFRVNIRNNSNANILPLEIKVTNEVVTFTKYENNVYVTVDTGITCKKNEWLRISFDINCAGYNSDVYINGEKFSFGYNKAKFINWIQLTAGYSAAGTGTKSGKLYLDDINVYQGANTFSDAEKVSYTIDPESGISYNDITKKFTVPENAEIDDVLNAIETTGSKCMIVSNSDNSRITSGTVAEGNTIVLTSPDGKTFDYFELELEGVEQVIDYGTINYEKDFNSADQQQSDGKLKVSGGKTYPITYPTAVGGKATSDSSFLVTHIDDSISGGIEIPFYPFTTLSSIGASVVTLETSVMFSGETNSATLSSYVSHHPSSWNLRLEVIEWVKFTNGKIFVCGADTGLKYHDGEWVRIAVEEHATGTLHYVYINGTKFTVNNSTAGIYGNRWTQFTSSFTSAGNGNKTGTMALDDIKIYDRAYTVTGMESVGYTVNETDAFNYIEASKVAFLNENTTVENLLNAVQTDNTKECHVSLSDPTVITTGKAADGNVVVVKSENGKAFDYLHATTSQDFRIIYNDAMSSGSTFTTFGTGDELSKVNETGLYAKDTDDYSFTLQSNLPVGTSANFRSKYMTDIPTELFDEDSFTYEFSIAMEGDVDGCGLANFVSETDNERFAYNNPVVFRDGKIYVNDNGVKKFVRNYREKEWYHIGITYYPKELKQDIYVNGIKYITKGWVVDDPSTDMRDPSKHKLTGFLWNQISASYEDNLDKVRSGKIAVDDVLLYHGEHFDTADYRPTFESYDYATGGDIANDIYLDEDGIELESFVESVDIDVDNTLLYTDSDYSIEAELVEYGTTIVCTSPNGLVKEYYVVLSPDVNIDNDIKCFVNGYEKQTFAEKSPEDTEYVSTLSATANAVAPAFELGHKGSLILAIYQNGVLVDMVTDAKEIKSATRFKVSYVLNTTEGMTAKAMFVNSLNTLKPYAPSKTFTVE